MARMIPENIRATSIFTMACLAFAATVFPCAADETNSLEIQSVMVNDKAIPIANHDPVNLGAFPINIVFRYGAGKNSTNPPLRMRYMLEGYEKNWHEASTPRWR